jgi:hypothetical protein
MTIQQRPSLKILAVAGDVAAEPQTQNSNGVASASHSEPTGRIAQTRDNTRQVSGHYKPDVAQALRMLAAEQDREQQDLLAEALNMLFERYGKATRAAPLGSRLGSRRKKM